MAAKGGDGLTKYLARLESYAPVPESARFAFLTLPTKVREYSANSEVVREGSDDVSVFFVESGILSRYKTMRTGKRQTVSFDIAADLAGLEYALVPTSVHGVRTHTSARLITVAKADILNLAARHFELAKAFWCYALADAASLREWISNLGQRDARGRTAHLLLELAARHQNADLLVGSTFYFPVTQQDLADALAMTPVHLNRVLQWMRNEKLVSTSNRFITLENVRALKMLCGLG